MKINMQIKLQPAILRIHNPGLHTLVTHFASPLLFPVHALVHPLAAHENSACDSLGVFLLPPVFERFETLRLL